MRRLYSTFAGGWPGIGLLLMRIVIGSALVVRASSVLRADSSLVTVIAWTVLAGAGVLIVPGLWTPIAGTVVAAIEIGHMFVFRPDVWAPLLVGTMAAALAMLGPGLWSIDARLFGWKRVEASPRTGRSKSAS